MAKEITRKKLGERVYRILGGGSTKPELKIKIQDAMLAVSQSRDQAILELFYEKKAQDEHTFPYDILSEFTLEVENGVINLPRRGLSVLKHNSGIYRVSTLDSDNPEEIIPVSTGFKTLYAKQASIGLEGNPYYSPFQDQLRVTGVADGCKVLVEMVVAGEYFDDNEFFCIPPELENEVVRNAIETLTIMYNAMEDVATDSRANG